MSFLIRSSHAGPIGVIAGATLAATALLSAPAVAGESKLADLVEHVSPSVVTILATQSSKQGQGDGASAFEDFMRRFGTPNHTPNPDSGARPAQAIGSGFFIEADGYIVTNNHVVDQAAKVRVRLTDKREFDATVIGTDEQTDLALLKIDATKMPFLKLGNSDDIRVGEDVVAVGNPFGLGGTVTRGIVSAKARDIFSKSYVDFIQTDAAINKGNSGGPLFDLDGDVIGVNSAIYSPTGGSVGVGFAIPSNTVKMIVADLKDDGAVDRGWLGVAIQQVTPEIAAALSLDEEHGALVSQVVEGSPSEGLLKVGDVVLSLDGKPINDLRDLPRLVGMIKAGELAEMTVLRDGAETTVKVMVGARMPEHQASLAPTAEPASLHSDALGASLASLTAEFIEGMDLADDATGAIVTEIDAAGAAADAGMQVGDIIAEVGGHLIKSPADVEQAVASAKNGAALLLIKRAQSQIFVGVKIAA